MGAVQVPKTVMVPQTTYETVMQKVPKTTYEVKTATQQVPRMTYETKTGTHMVPKYTEEYQTVTSMTTQTVQEPVTVQVPVPDRQHSPAGEQGGRVQDAAREHVHCSRPDVPDHGPGRGLYLGSSRRRAHRLVRLCSSVRLHLPDEPPGCHRVHLGLRLRHPGDREEGGGDRDLKCFRHCFLDRSHTPWVLHVAY